MFGDEYLYLEEYFLEPALNVVTESSVNINGKKVSLSGKYDDDNSFMIGKYSWPSLVGNVLAHGNTSSAKNYIEKVSSYGYSKPIHYIEEIEIRKIDLKKYIQENEGNANSIISKYYGDNSNNASEKAVADKFANKTCTYVLQDGRTSIIYSKEDKACFYISLEGYSFKLSPMSLGTITSSAKKAYNDLNKLFKVL